MIRKQNILVAPLNWGLGHATRCIPVIKALLEHHYNPIIASDGAALQLLTKEFPKLETIELPSYGIKYAKKGQYMKFKLASKIPAILRTIQKEKLVLKKLVAQKKIHAVISDNRFGLYNKNIPCVFITHQLTVLSGNTTWLSSKIHQQYIKKFTACWVTDVNEEINLSGALGHPKTKLPNVKYIGPLSRFHWRAEKEEFEYLIVLSGPEPQRSYFEEIAYNEFLKTDKKTLFIKGVLENKQVVSHHKNITVYNYMTSTELENAILKSNVIIARSGYSSIMDLAQLQKKAFFVPTPGQYEQEYLAERLQDLGIAPYCRQKEFCFEAVEQVSNFKGLKSINSTVDYLSLFEVLNNN